MPPGMPFVPFQQNRKPGESEKVCPTCQGSGSVDTHVCKTCHHAGVVPKEWKQGDGPVKPGNPVKMGTPVTRKPGGPAGGD
jgi:DnaJ-class molecular chaperone